MPTSSDFLLLIEVLEANNQGVGKGLVAYVIFSC